MSNNGLAKRVAARLTRVRATGSKLGMRPKARFLAAFIAIALVATAVCLQTFKVEASSAPASAATTAKIRWTSPSFGGLMSNTRLTGALANYLEPDVLTTGVCSGTRNIPGDYATLAAAITDINTFGVSAGLGGCTLNLIAGNPQTAPAGGYSINFVANPSTAADPLIITGNGNTITAGVGVSTTNDAFFKLIGADSVTLQGFTMLESAGNVTATTQVEWGVALLYATTTNGAQNDTIQNNTITLNRTNANTFGIYSNSTHTATVVGTSATATTTAGGNSGLKIYGNTISNVNQGISVVGPLAAADMNTGLDIGGTGGVQANSITNWGTASTGSYANLSGTLNCILVRNSIGFNVSFNTITSSVGGNTATASQRGIYVPSFSIAPTGTFTSTINSNNISVQSGFVTGTLNGIIVETTTGTATSSISISSNNFNTFGHTVASPTGAVNFINDTMANLNTTINSNTFTAITLTTTGSVLFIGHSVTNPAGGIDNISSNMIVTSFTKTGTGGGTLTFINNSAGSSTTVTQTWNSNNFSNITVPGTTAIAGMVCTDGGTVNHKCNSNTISNITLGTGSFTGINSSFGGALGGNGNEVIGNTITNVSSAGAITGILVGSSGTTTTVSSNTIGNFSSTGASAVVGITSAAPTSATISKNKIYDLGGTNAGTTVNGIAITAGSSYTIVNNIVGNLTASAATVTSPASAIIGINLTSATSPSTINVYFNTVYINTSSSGTNFATTGIFHAASATATIATLNLRNNIIDNRSTPSGTGFTAVYRRSSGASGTLANYASTSNNNDFFLGTAGANKFIYSDGTSTATTIAAYKAGVFTAGTISPRDSVSFSDPTYVSTIGTDATFLHINTSVPTQVESGGAPIAGITDDFDTQTRQGNGGYVGTGTAPDVGADEFEGVALDLTAPTITYTPLGNTALLTNRVLSVTITDANGVASGGLSPRIYFKRTTEGTYVSTQCVLAGAPNYNCTIDYSALPPPPIATGDVLQYFVVAQDTPGNVGANPSAGFTATNVNTVTSPPTTPNSYTIIAAIAAAVNVGTGEIYPTLTGAGGLFAAINASVLNQNVTATITTNMTEDGTNALNQWVEEGVGGYTLTIQPDAAAVRVISGAVALSGMIRLNGADRVTFDGRFGGSGQFLRFRNTNASNPTFTFLNDATNNTIDSCLIEGNNTSATSGTILFSTSTGTLGNSGNTIIRSDIRDRSDITLFPANGVYSSGSAGAPNGTNTISSCNVFNFTNAGVLVSATGAGNGWVVNPSSFFATAARITALTAISIQGGSGHSIVNNSIGGTAPLAGGSFLATSSTFRGIDLTVGTASPTSVQGNTVKNIRSTLTGSFTASYGIFVQAGTVNLGGVTGNTVGSSSPAERYEISGDSFAIRVISSATCNVSNNIVNNFTTAPGVPTGEFYFGMVVEGSGGVHSVINNTITNVTNGSTPDSGFDATTTGLIVSATGIQTIRGNTISNIGSTDPTAVATRNVRVWGMIVSGTPVGTVVEKNSISNIYASSAGAGARVDVITCLQSQSGANATYSNNMISTTGGGASSDRAIFGILDLSASPAISNYYFNSVNITGTATAANNTYAFNRSSTATVTLRNNIFADTRTGGTGFHVAMANTNAAATGWAPTASDFNVLFNAVPGNLTQWLGSAVGNNRTLAGWQASQGAGTPGSGGDANSINADPLFTSATDLHINPLTAATSPVNNAGIPFGGVTDDFDAVGVRTTSTPDIGADEFVVNFSSLASGSLAAGTYDNVTINSPDTVTLAGHIKVFNAIIVKNGATLNCGAFIVSGPATFLIEAGGTLGVGDPAGITTSGLTGNIQVTGTRTYTVGANYVYNGTAAQFTGNALANAPNNLTIDNPTSVTSSLPGLTVTGLLRIIQGTFVSASDYNNVQIDGGTLSLSGPITVSGNWTNNATFTHNGFAVTFDGTGTQTVTKLSTETFSTLIINKASGDFTIASNTVISVDGASGNVFQFLSGGVDLNNRSITLTGAAGNILVDGGNRTVGGPGGFSFMGDTVVTSTGGGTLTFGANVFVTPNNPGNSVDFGANLTTLNGTLLLNYDGIVNNGPTYGAGSELRYNSGGTYLRHVEWNSTSGQGYPFNVRVSAGTSVRMGNNGGSAIAKQLAGSLTIDSASTLTMQAGVPMTASLTVLGDVNINGTLTLSTSAGGDLNVGGNFTNNGTFNANGRITTFDGSSNQNVGGTSANNFAGLTMNGAGGATLTAAASVSDVLTLTNGKITTGLNTLSMGSAATSTGASGASYVIGTQKKTYGGAGLFTFDVGTVNGYSQVDTNVTAGTGDLTVTATQTAQPVLTSATSLQRYWTLTEGGAITADLTFHYLIDATDVMGTESNYRLIVVESGNATSFPENCPTVACVDETLNTIKKSGVDTFSDWTAGEPNAPTAVKLSGFSAVRSGDEVMLSWQSGYEARNLGYYIYREQNGKRVQITPSLVAGSALIAGRQTNLTAGLSYSWIDSNQQSAISNQQSVYWLEDVDLDGTRTLHGPVAIAECGMRNADCQKLSERSALLGELSSRQSAVGSQQSGVEFSSGPARSSGANIGIEPVDEGGDAAEMQRTIAGMAGLKIAISQAGWYRLNQADVLEAGFKVEDAKGLQLYRNGQQVPFRLSNSRDEFGPGDYLEFYGEGLSSPTEREQTYYLVKVDEAGQRIRTERAMSSGNPEGPQSFAYTVERKERMIYFSALLNGDGENFFGQVVNSSPVTAALPISQLEQSSDGAQLEVELQGVSSQSHLVQVRFNGTELGTINFANTAHPNQTFNVPAAALQEGNNTVELTALGGAADVSLVDVLRLTYVRRYAAENNALTFSVNSKQTKRISGFSNEQIRVVDVTDPYNPLELTPEVLPDGEGFAADIQTLASLNNPHTLVAFIDGPGTGANALRLNEPSSWWSERAGADYVIISTAGLKASVEPLAQLRRNQGLVVHVVDVEDLYDEFSFGKHSPQAVHDFLARATTTWTRQPHYLLLAGDASYDPKNYTGQGLNDLVPTKLVDTALTETASDDWLADFNADGIADLAIGRLPVRTAAQVDALVAKIVNYENATPDPSRAALLVADNSFEGQSSALQGLLPSGMTVQTINRSSADDATIHNQIITGLNQGPLVTNYIGHGSNGVWTGASLLSSNDAPNLTNVNRLSVFTMMTCYNGYFQDAYNDSLSEALLKAPGGAVAVWASTTLTEPSGQNAIDQEFYRLLFGAQPQTLGDAARAAKTATGDADVRRTWTLFGDPAMRLR